MATDRSGHSLGNDTHAHFIRQLRAGKRRAWRTFERECIPDIVDQLRGLGADQRGITEEVLGKVLERVWSRLDQYQGESFDQWRGWVGRITRNLFWDELRRYRRERGRRKVSLDESIDTEEGAMDRAECIADAQASPEQVFAIEELVEKVWAAVERRLGSSERQRAICRLLRKGIVSPVEIASILQMSPGAVSVHKNVIFRLARQCCERLGGERGEGGR